MHKGDILNFTLSGGRTNVVKIVDAGIDVYYDFGEKQWTLWADIKVDGHPLRLVYSPHRMKALYEPKVVNGMRIALDGVQGLPSATGEAGSNSTTNPSKDVRIWVNDAGMPVMPGVHIWVDLYQDRAGQQPDSYGGPHEFPKNSDYRMRQDRDVHPTSYLLDVTDKTGYLG